MARTLPKGAKCGKTPKKQGPGSQPYLLLQSCGYGLPLCSYSKRRPNECPSETLPVPCRVTHGTVLGKALNLCVLA